MNMSRYEARPGELKLLQEVISGHCHRVELYLRVLGLRYETVDVDLHNGEAKSTAFTLCKSANAGSCLASRLEGHLRSPTLS